MSYLDRHPHVMKWSSEEVVIPYKSPIDGRLHRYFPDFYMKYKNKQNMIVEELIEVKPFSQCSPPNPKKKLTKTGRTSKRYLKEVQTYMVNDAKWTQAMSFCKDRQWKWRILTEKDINAY